MVDKLMTHPKSIVDRLLPSLAREGKIGACDDWGESTENYTTKYIDLKNINDVK